MVKRTTTTRKPKSANTEKVVDNLCEVVLALMKTQLELMRQNVFTQKQIAGLFNCVSEIGDAVARADERIDKIQEAMVAAAIAVGRSVAEPASDEAA